jgi:gamma-butyrobetaine dioxygenase
VATTPDFVTYPSDVAVADAVCHDRWVEVTWTDRRSSRFHHLWLRDNCPCPSCVAQITREQTFEILAVPAGLTPDAVERTRVGDLFVRWPDGHESIYDTGWLRDHVYDRADPHTRSSTRSTPRTSWDSSSFSAPPTFDATAVMTRDDALHDWLVALSTFGCTRVRGLPDDPDVVGELAARIGVVRHTNFGVLWDVKSEPDPITNANTSLRLPPHVDLPTREYQPGVQFLHCLVNDATGGDSVLVDGLRVAEIVKAESPAHFRTLTTVPWNWANRSRTSDYRWSSPLIVLDGHGEMSEIRVGNWLRAPLVDVGFDRVEEAYEAYRHLFEVTYRKDLVVQFRLVSGDCMVFDNRRVLHARTGFDPNSGPRFLRGCYSEREEVESRLRVLKRAGQDGSTHS